MISDMTPSIDLNYRNVFRVQYMLRITSLSLGIDRFMAQQPNLIVSVCIPMPGKILHRFKDWLVILQTEPADNHIKSRILSTNQILWFSAGKRFKRGFCSPRQSPHPCCAPGGVDRRRLAFHGVCPLNLSRVG